jgi:hypothetical protein
MWFQNRDGSRADESFQDWRWLCLAFRVTSVHREINSTFIKLSDVVVEIAE